MHTQRPEVLFPVELVAAKAEGALYGYWHPETRVFNIIGCGKMPARSHILAPCQCVGYIGSGTTAQAFPLSGDSLIGEYRDDQAVFTFDGNRCTTTYYSLVQDIFSRNTGILETSRMAAKSAMISGCGSVGSLVALELARAGVGRFLLLDNDILNYNNICRHQSGITDVGRYKVDAVRDRILDINPRANVTATAAMIQQLNEPLLREYCAAESVIVGCADNREADLYANRLSCIFRVPFVSIGLWERAFAGEVFWSKPGETPCYFCAFGTYEEPLSARTTVNRRIYTTEENLTRVAFEPGISVDIGFVTMVAIKIILDLLGCHDGSMPRVITSLRQFSLICNTNNPMQSSKLTEIFDHPLQITRSIEIARLDSCPHCKLAVG